MTNLEQRIIRLEQLATAQADNNIRIWAAIAALQQAVRTTQQGAYGGGSGGGATTFFIDPVVIAAGGNVTSQTIYASVSGTLTATATTNATVYNNMNAATVATASKIIVVSPNADGSYSVVTQSC